MWLVNTGWSGGGYGVGERLPIEVSRACVDAILGDAITEYEDFPILIWKYRVFLV